VTLENAGQSQKEIEGDMVLGSVCKASVMLQCFGREMGEEK
jgi:hypothetical protein